MNPLTRLPESLEAVIREVVEASGLEYPERAEVEDDLPTHFEEGHLADMDQDELMHRFGDPSQAGKEIRVAYRDGKRRRRFVFEGLVLLLLAVNTAKRLFRQRPGLTLTAVLTLALGIGANTTVFSVVSGVLLSPLPYPESDRIVRVFDEHPQFPHFPLSPANFLDYRDLDLPFRDFAVYLQADLDLAEADRPQRLTAMRVSSGFFRVLGMEPMLGRGFTREEETAGNHYVAVLSYDLWRSHFNSDPGILGNTLHLSGRPYTVIGIAPPGTRHPSGGFRSAEYGEPVDLWRPLVMGPDEQPRFSHYLNGIARLVDDVSVEEAEARMKVIASEIAAGHSSEIGPCTVELVSLKEEVVGESRTMLFVLFAASGVILLIACVNVAGLILARTAERRGELAVRVALGAGDGDLAKEMLSEGLVLAVLGGLAAVGLAVAGVPVLLGFAPEGLPRVLDIGVDMGVMAFAALIALGSAFLASFVSMLQVRGFDVGSVLRGGGGRVMGQATRIREGLVVAQTTLAVILLVSGGLLLRSFLELRSVDPGFRADRVVTASLSLPSARYPNDQERATFLRGLLGRLEEAPSVEVAGLADALPWTGVTSSSSFEIEGWVPPGDLLLSARYHSISPGYLEAIGVPTLSGRGFTYGDDLFETPVALINEAMALKFWEENDGPGEPLGSQITTFDRTWTIIGIVGNVGDGPTAGPAPPAMYFPVFQNPTSAFSVIARARGDALTLAPHLRETVNDLDPGLPVTAIGTLKEVVVSASSDAWFSSLLVGLFAGVALVLAIVGLFGLIASFAVQQEQELAVRAALGAQKTELLRLIVGKGMALAGGGLTLGIILSLGSTRLLRSILFQVNSLDPFTYAGVTGCLLVTAGLACFLPAMRAAGKDPVRVLRGEKE